MEWPDAELSITLVNDPAMGKLNKATFGRVGPTNVISFPLDAVPVSDKISTQEFGNAAGAAINPPSREHAGLAPPASSTAGPLPFLGEVVISLETTRRQAQEYGWPWRELLDFFLIHGILHLLGYDHDNSAAETQMTERTWDLMSLLYPGRRWDEEL